MAAAFLAAGFFAAGFLAAGFLAAGFLAAGFLAAAFLGEAAFLAAGFLAAGFLAGDLGLAAFVGTSWFLDSLLLGWGLGLLGFGGLLGGLLFLNFLLTQTEGSGGTGSLHLLQLSGIDSFLEGLLELGVESSIGAGQFVVGLDVLGDSLAG